MASIKRFEDIEAWKRSRELTRKVYACSKRREFARDFGLKDQMRRASVSSGELRSQLYVTLDEGYITQEQFDAMYNDAVAISKMVSGFMEYLQKSDLRGSKYAIREH